ncbi:MAG: endonuclease/exonuclease/phosphatase family protein [Gemmatimonadota bacterium]
MRRTCTAHDLGPAHRTDARRTAPSRRRVRKVPAALALLLAGCGWVHNYPDTEGPRYAGGAPSATPSAGPDTLTIVTFNIEQSDHIDRALDVLRGEPVLREVDVVLLQEMDATGTARVARALGMEWVYYPGSVEDQRDFGNAVLSRWPIADDAKLVLPHLSVFGERQRTATVATLQVGDARVRVYSVHLSTPINQAEPERRDQLEAVLRDARGWRHVVIGGDLNAGNLGDMATRRGFLWPTEEGPRTVFWGRWDHIFLKGLVLPAQGAAGTVLDNRDASDHKPVWVRAILGGEGGQGVATPGAPGHLGGPRHPTPPGFEPNPETR